MANSDVKLKHKVQLRKKVEEPDATVEPAGVETDNTPIPTPEKPKSKTWIWVILGIVVVCIIGYFIFSKSGDTTVTEPTQETEVVDEAVVSTDSVNDQEQVSDDALPNEDVSNDAAGQEATVSDAPEAPVNTTNNTAEAPAKNANVSNDVEAEAMKVIRGDYGVGQERKDKLGSQYQTIQSRVNELKREGIF